jgi:Na+/H+-translocating membrane pyrophosphatase
MQATEIRAASTAGFAACAFGIAPNKPGKPGCQYGPMNLSKNNLVAKVLSVGFWAGLLTGNTTLTAAAAAVYVDLVNTGGAWDPKNGPGGPTPVNVEAGNVNFGATCSQFGLHTQVGGEVCQYGAGVAGHLNGSSSNVPFSDPAHGDAPADNLQVKQGLTLGDC